MTTTQVVLLRAVNVGGTGKLPMSALRACLESLGYADVRTLLQSGNIVLRAAQAGAALETELETALAKHLQLRTTVITRTPAQCAALIAANPFPGFARDNPSHLLVLFTKHFPTPAALTALQAAAKSTGGDESIATAAGHLYLTFPHGIGRSKLTTALIERSLATPTTARNWNTVLKLAAMCAE